MGLKSAGVLFAIGLAVVAVGLAASGSAEVRIMALVIGVVTLLSGLVLAARDAFQEEARSKQSTRDTPALLRVGGGFLGLASLLLPYIKIPLSPTSERTAYSLPELLGLLQEGAEIEGGFILLLFMGVVVAGSFISFFHHAGGYVMLLGSMAFTFVTIQALQSDLLNVATQEFQAGLYIAVLASLIIISSSLIRTSEKGIQATPPPGGRSW